MRVPQELDPQELAGAQQSAAAWARIVRAPRQRHRHVLMDVCSAHVSERGADTSRGHLVRQVRMRVRAALDVCLPDHVLLVSLVAAPGVLLTGACLTGDWQAGQAGLVGECRMAAGEKAAMGRPLASAISR